MVPRLLRYAPLLVLLSMLTTGCGENESDDAGEVARVVRAGEAEEVLQRVGEALEEDPDDASLHRRRILLLLSREDVFAAAEAVRAFREMQARCGPNPILGEAVRSSVPRIRANAIKALSLMKVTNAGPVFRRAVDDTSEEVRQAAARALGEIPEKRNLFPLLLCLKDANWKVRGEAAKSLGRLGQPKAASYLFRLLDDPDEYVRYEARNALLGLPGDENLAVYRRELNWGIGNRRTRVAALALSGAGDSSAIPVLRAIIESHGSEDRLPAAWTLAASFPEEALGLFESRAETEPDPRVQTWMVGFLRETARGIGKDGEPESD
jgi:HEAT repeat protein